MKNFLLDIIKTMVFNKIDFVVCGGVACILQGCDRATFDLDVNLVLSDENLNRFISVCKKRKLQPRIPVPMEQLLNPEIRQMWLKEKGALVYTVISIDGMLQIDLFLDYPIPFDRLKANADTLVIDGCHFLVSSKADLLTAKKNVVPLRDKDMMDIKQLEELLKND